MNLKRRKIEWKLWKREFEGERDLGIWGRNNFS